MKTSETSQLILALGVIALLSFAGACAPAADTGSTEDAAAAEPVDEYAAEAVTEATPEVDPAVVESVVTACQAEVDTYCSQVTPGDGRLLACFAAHADKLSGGCSSALYGFVAELEAFTRATAYMANACYEDITSFCADVEAGDARVANCLIENQAEISAECAASVGLQP